MSLFEQSILGFFNPAYCTVQYDEVTQGRHLFQAPCGEKYGVVLRSVRQMPKTVEAVDAVEEQMKRVRNFLGRSNARRVFLNERSEFYLIDDVGIIGAVGLLPGVSAHVHMTFWDGRLRGREVMARMIVGHLMISHQLGGAWTGVPKKHKAVIAFARRVGFKSFFEDQENVGLLLLRRDY